MTRGASAVLAMAAFYALFGPAAAVRGADQGVTGKKLLMKAGKVVLISKDPTITTLGSNPVAGADSSISFDGGSGPVVLALPRVLWTADAAGLRFKYKNPSVPGGASPVKVAKVAPGLLKVVAKGVPIAVPNGAATVRVVLSLDGGANAYCMSFSGTGDGSALLVGDSGAGTCGTCGNGIREGGEVCDGADSAACPGGCLADCRCPVCGDNVREGNEACDGSDNTACPGHCSDCACPELGPCVGGSGYPTCGGSCPIGQECIAVSNYAPPVGPYSDCLCANVSSGARCPSGQALDPGYGCATVPTCYDRFFSYPLCSGGGATPGHVCQAVSEVGQTTGICAPVSGSDPCSGSSLGPCGPTQDCVVATPSNGCRDRSAPYCSGEGTRCGSCALGICAVNGGTSFEYSGPGSVCADIATCTVQACSTDADCPAGKGCGANNGTTMCCGPCP